MKEFNEKTVEANYVTKEVFFMGANVLMSNSIIAGESLFSIAKARINSYYDTMLELCGRGEFKRYGKYLVKETFEGDRTLSDLLSDYIERTASLKY